MPVVLNFLQSPLSLAFLRPRALLSLASRGHEFSQQPLLAASPSGGRPLPLTRYQRHIGSLRTASTAAPVAEASAASPTAAGARFGAQTGAPSRGHAAGHPDDPPTFVKATGKILSIGDLHGDLAKAVRALQAARVMAVDEEGRPVWVGADTVVVQLGDVLDRGDQEIRIIMLLRDLDRQARLQGGAVYMLNGNHESLNVCGDFRYVTVPAFVEGGEYVGAPDLGPINAMQKAPRIRHLQYLANVRHSLYRPGGPMAVELAKNPTVLVVNDTAFAHGGLLPSHVAYGIERLNAEVAAWMRQDPAPNGGFALPPFLAMGDAKSVMWNRALSKEVFAPHERFLACRALKQALEKIGAKRLVVGHTPQLSGCNSECEGAVWRIDIGMSEGVLNKAVQVLEVRQDALGATVVEVLGEDGKPISSEFWDTGAGPDIFPLHM